MFRMMSSAQTRAVAKTQNQCCPLSTRWCTCRRADVPKVTQISQKASHVAQWQHTNETGTDVPGKSTSCNQNGDGADTSM